MTDLGLFPTDASDIQYRSGHTSTDEGGGHIQEVESAAEELERFVQEYAGSSGQYFPIRLSDFLFPIHVKHTHKDVAHGYGHQVGPKVGQVSIVDVVAVYVWPVHGRPEEGDGEQYDKQCNGAEEAGGHN